MTEISNNNIGKYGYNIQKVEKEKEKAKECGCANCKAEEKSEQNYMPDTGVLGRSQVKSKNGGNIPKSVDEAVALAAKKPEILLGSEDVFTSIYDKLIKEGMPESEAYIQALMAEDEFLSIASCH